MRIKELGLERYGHFENLKLALPPAKVDFHIIFGPNEAGKSTTLAAVSDLLFGFPHRAEYDFRFDAKLLRIGAVLQNGEDQIACRRKRGAKGTLVDGKDQPIDEGPLLAMLRNETREGFRSGSSLDHLRMREGGRAIVEAKDDIGQALFAAGSGLTGVVGVLDDLTAEADLIWAKRGADRRAYTRAERDYEAARRALRELLLKPADWKHARDELTRLSAVQSDLDEQLRSVTGELTRVERLRRVFEPLRRRAVLLQSRNQTTVTQLTAIVERGAEVSLSAAAEAERRYQAATGLREQAIERRDDVKLDEAILKASETVDTLLEQRGSVAKGLTDLPRRETELDGLEVKMNALADELGISTEASGSFSLPSRVLVSELRQLSEVRAANEVELRAIETERRGLERHLERLKLEKAEPVSADDLERLQHAVLAGRRLGDLEQQLTRRRTALRRLEKDRDTALARLEPWTGSGTDLAGLSLPADEAIDNARDLIEAAATKAKDERQKVSGGAEDVERLAHSAAGLSVGGQAVPIEKLVGARYGRDRGWAQIRNHLTDGSPMADPVAEADSFEHLVREADTLADLRFASSEASGRLSQLEAQVSGSRLEIEQASRRLAGAEREQNQATESWTERLKSAGLPELLPSDFRVWRDLRAAALTSISALEAAREEVEADAQRVSSTRALLFVSLGEKSESDRSFAAVLDKAEGRLDALLKRGLAAESLKEQVGKACEQIEDVDERKGQLAATQALLKAQWDRATGDAGIALTPGSAQTRLGLCEELRGLIETVADRRHRIESIRKDVSEFDARVADIAKDLNQKTTGQTSREAVDGLRIRLTEARKSEQAHAGLQDEVDRHDEAMRAAAADLHAADRSLDVVRELTDAKARPAIADAVEASRAQRKLADDIAEIEREIAKSGDGVALVDLEEACREEDADALGRSAGDLRARQEELTLAAREAAGLCAKARTEFETLDSGDKAAAAASDLAAARAEMSVQADAYVVNRAQALIMKWAIERYRARHQNPILIRASELFKTLTLGRFAELRISNDGPVPRLFGLRVDGETVVEVDGMSEGTQDQLFLALRIAALEQGLETGARLPFLADDLFVNFDDDRARAGFQVLGELAKSTQVIFFTHHKHLVEIARVVFPAATLSIVDLMTT